MKKTTLSLLLALLCAPAYAQINDSLIVLFESRAGLRMALGDNANLWRQNDPRDANDDGLAELAMIVDDEAGNPEAFLVLTQKHSNRYAAKQADVLSHGWNDSLLYFKWDDLLTLLGGREPTRFMGFYPFFGSAGGLKDLVFRTDGGVAIIGILDGSGKQAGGSMPSFTVSADHLTIADLNDDGVPELLVRNPDTGTVQVWGRSSTSTAAEEEIEVVLLRLFQNYPNPFQTSTTIAYDVEHPGPVTVDVYDLLGRRVRTLVDDVQPVGAYQVAWDGRDTGGQPVASGTYFYRLRVGEAVSSKQAIRIK